MTPLSKLSPREFLQKMNSLVKIIQSERTILRDVEEIPLDIPEFEEEAIKRYQASPDSLEYVTIPLLLLNLAEYHVFLEEDCESINRINNGEDYELFREYYHLSREGLHSQRKSHGTAEVVRDEHLGMMNANLTFSKRILSSGTRDVKAEFAGTDSVTTEYYFDKAKQRQKEIIQRLGISFGDSNAGCGCGSSAMFFLGCGILISYTLSQIA